MEYDFERDVVAMAMVLMAEEHDVTFRRGGVALEAPTAMISASLVLGLMKLARFSINMPEPSTSTSGAKLLTYLPGEDILMALAFDHAIEMSPRSDEYLRKEGSDRKSVVDIDELMAMVTEIESARGRIDIDHDMVTRVSSAAARRISAEYSAEQSPSGG